MPIFEVRVHVLKWLWLLVIFAQGACGFARAAAEAEFVHLLKPGESIWTVARDYLEPPHEWRALQRYNGVRRDRQMPPGTAVRVPLSWLRRIELMVEVIRVTGNAQWSRVAGGPPQALSTGSRLRHGDRVTTESQAYVTLRLPDGSMAQVAQNSAVTIHAVQLLGTAVTEVSLRVDRGRVETQVMPQTTPGSSFEIRTPAAQLGVRGTRFRVGVSADGKDSTAEVESGRVVAGNHTLPGSPSVDLEAGFGTVVREGQPPLPPVAMLPAVDLRTAQGLELGPEVRQSFEALAGAVAYRVQLASDASFQQILTERITVTPNYRFSMLPDARYYLRVRAVDALGIEGHEARITFSVRELDL